MKFSANIHVSCFMIIDFSFCVCLCGELLDFS